VAPRARRAARPRAAAALVLIDFPEFNLRLERVARRAGVPVRIRPAADLGLAAVADARHPRPRVARARGVPVRGRALPRGRRSVEFVGHPVLDALEGAPAREAARHRLGLGAGELVIGVLPGAARRRSRARCPS
jgi:lipid-A-disaccharide synthase